MKQPDYIAGFFIALLFHGFVLTTMAGMWRGDVALARPLFQQGESSMAITFVAPSSQGGYAAVQETVAPSGISVYSEPGQAETKPFIFVSSIPPISPAASVKVLALPEKKIMPVTASEVFAPIMDFAKLENNSLPGVASSGQSHDMTRPQSDADGLSKGVGTGAQAVGDVRPVYPMGARLRGEQGSVVVRVKVGHDGRVKEKEVTRSSGYLDLDQSAIKAISRARFEPARKNGEPTSSETHITFRFRLENQ